MNPVHIVEAARPVLAPIPVLERNRLRERLFDVVVERPTVPSIQSATPPSRRGNLVKLAALCAMGLVGVGAVGYSALDERETQRSGPATETQVSTPVSVSEPAPPAAQTAPSTAPSTTAAPIAGSDATPLLLPEKRSRLDDLEYVQADLGGSTAFLRAPDLSTLVLVEADGVAYVPPTQVDEDPEDDVTPTPVWTVAGIDLATPAVDDSRRYDITVPCGSWVVYDSPTAPEFRPTVIRLLESTRIVDGIIDIDLPGGWQIVDIGRSADRFSLVIPMQISEDSRVSVSLTQFPDSSVSVALTPGKQYAPATFQGQGAWLSRDPVDPDEVEIVGRLGTTAFSVSATGLTLPELELAIANLTPGNTDDWVGRFGPLTAEADPDIRTCADQPAFDISTP